MIRLSGQRFSAAAMAAARSARARRAPPGTVSRPAAGSPGAGGCRRSGQSWFGRGRETEGQDGQVVVQVTSVELADTIDHLVEQLLPGLVRARPGRP